MELQEQFYSDWHSNANKVFWVLTIGIMILCFLAKADTGNSCSSNSSQKGTLIYGPNGPFIQIDSGGSVNVEEIYGNMVRDQHNESWHLYGTSVVKM